MPCSFGVIGKSWVSADDAKSVTWSSYAAGRPVVVA